jgi:hypothetical protein
MPHMGHPRPTWSTSGPNKFAGNFVARLVLSGSCSCFEIELAAWVRSPKAPPPRQGGPPSPASDLFTKSKRGAENRRTL